MKIDRCSENPLIKPANIPASQENFEVIGVFNCGAARFGDEVVLLLRVAEKPISEDPDIEFAPIYNVEKGRIFLKEFSRKDKANDFSDPRLIIRGQETYLTSISHFRVAKSKDGVYFAIEDKISFGAETDYESFGVEDPRISLIEGVYYISYVAVSENGVVTALASTKDFRNFERKGIIFCPDNKDVVIFPERIGGKFYSIHRPVSSLFGRHDMWISQSPDLVSWGDHRRLIGVREGFWDEMKIGAGAVPVKTDQGWLEIYHGVNPDNQYSLGALLLDLNEPWKVLARSKKPVMKPEADYEREGFFGDVVFSCGLLLEEEKLKIYYGACDTSICYAQVMLEDVLKSLVCT
ncbi:MAG: glycoside hydrolase family 130 protein [Planctomycetota bacterium]|jgi:predicted GH43/DUF377 family glycosyl hydrolase